MAVVVGAGRVSTAVTVFSYVGGSPYPVTGRQETGGTTAPTLEVAPRVFVFNWNALTSPYAESPPPFDGRES